MISVVVNRSVAASLGRQSGSAQIRARARIVKKSIRTAAVSVLVLVLLCTIVSVEAQTPDNGQGNANVIAQNMDTDTSSGNPSANVVAAYHNPNGSVADSLGTSIRPLAAKEFQISDTTIGQGWTGSTVLYSDEELASVVNLLWDGGAYGDGTAAASYTGFSQTSDTWYLPRVNVVFGQGRQVTQLSVQNADSTAATVWFRYYKFGESTPTAEVSVVIEAGGSRYYDLGSPGGDVPDLRGLSGGDWAGSAVVEAEDGKQLTAIAVNHWKGYSGAYLGVAQPSLSLVSPKMIRRAKCKDGDLRWKEFGQIVLQNPNVISATVDLAFYDKITGDLDLLLDDLEIGGQESIKVHLKNGGSIDPALLDPLDRDPGCPILWNGKVIVTSDTPIFGVANDIRRGEAASLYNLADTDSASGTLYLPAVFRINYGGGSNVYSRIALANMSGTEASVDYYLYDRDGNLDLTTTKTIPANGVGAFRAKEHAASVGDNWMGSIYAMADQDVIALVDTLWDGTGRFSTYNGLND